MSAYASSYPVRLRSGGDVTLSMTIDLFDLSEEDRAFVFDLVDRVRGYAQQFPGPGTGEPAGPQPDGMTVPDAVQAAG